MKDVPRASDLSGLIGKLYDCSLDRRRWAGFLEALARSFGSDQALSINVDSLPTPGGAMVSHGIDTDVIAKWKESKEHVDVWYQGLQTRRHDTAYRGLELCSKRTLLGSAFYADTLKKLDIEHTLGGLSVEDEGRDWMFAIYRSRRAGRFSREQQALFRLLVPHFRRAIRIGQLLAQREAQSQVFAEALERSAFGIVILDAFQNVLWTNGKADDIFVQSDGVTIRYGAIRFWDYATQKRFDRASARALSVARHEAFEADDALGVPRPSGQPAYQLSICPLNLRTEVVNAFDGAACMIVLHDPAAVRRLSAETLQHLYGLSPAESRLCAVLFERGSLAGALGALNVSRNTAKTQLRQIFEKVDVSSQAELLQRLAMSIC